MADQGRERQQRAASRVPPHNLAAEESLLGALLLSRDAITAVAELHLNATDFYKPAHQHVFEAIRVLAAVGEPVDGVTVAEELRRHDLLDAVGGAALLLDLQAATPAISNAPRYARIVQDTAMLRRLIGVAGEIAEIGYDEPDDVTKALDIAESKVFELADRRVVDSTKPIGDLLNLAISDLEQAYERGTALTGVPTGFTDLDELLNGLQPSTLNVIGARPSMGKCVAWDTELLDPATGELVTAAELHRRGSKGDWVQVVSLDPATGRLVVASPSHFVDDGVKPVYRVRTRLGREVRTTLTHPFLTEAGWRPLAQLDVGDRIAVPRALPWFGAERLAPNEAAIVAYLLGDGGLRSTVVTRKDDLLSRCRPLEIDPAAILRTHDLWHLDDDELRVPAAVFRLDRDRLWSFLDRLIGENRGSRPTHLAQDAFAARSERLVRDVQHLFLRFGILTERREETILRRGERHAVHALSLVPVGAPAHELELVASAAGASTQHPHGHAVALVPDTDICWDDIVALDHDGDEQVYDLTIPGHHNFVAADVIVHNTAFALGMASHVAVEAGAPVLFFSLEMGHKELTQRILSSEARVDSSKMRTGRLTEQDWSKIGKAIGRLEAPLFIDDNPNVTVMEIRAKARRMKARHGGLGLVVVDYLQLMSGRSTAENRQVEVSEISRGLKILARELEVPIVALSQLSRNLEARADKKPMLADLRESGCLTASTRLVRADTNEQITLGELVASGATDVPVWSLDERHRLVPATLTRAFSSGVKETFALRLASGRVVEASANHPFLTIDGWRRLDELTRFDRIAVARLLPEQATVPSRAAAHSGHHGAFQLVRSADGGVGSNIESPDLLWDRILGIEPLGRREVFDATVPGTHCFLANGIVAHNSIEQDADVVMFIYRDEVYNPDTQDRGVAEIIVSKHRNGPIGSRRLVFLAPYTRFDNAARGL